MTLLLDRRAFLGRAWRVGSAVVAARSLAGCLTTDDDATSAAVVSASPAPAYPPNRAEIEWFCGRFTPRRITQLGYVVPGVAPAALDEAMVDWGHTQGVGPFCLLRPRPSARAFHRARHVAITDSGQQAPVGDATNPDVELALAQVEDGAQIELILQRDLDPSTVYRAVYPAADQGGFHHACIVSNDVTTDLRTLVAAGFDACVRLDTLFTGAIGQILYVDTRRVPQLGCHFEITQDTRTVPTIAALYRAIHHLGTTLGPFGEGMSDRLAARLRVDRERLAATNVVVEARSFAELAARTLLLATRTGWVP